MGTIFKEFCFQRRYLIQRQTLTFENDNVFKPIQEKSDLDNFKLDMAD